MDKIKTVKIKNPNGSVSEETYTISVDAKNVDMANGKELQETIGTINIDTDGNIAYQLKNLKNDKVNKTDIIDNLNSVESNKVLSANQGKVLGDAVAALDTDIKKKVYYYNSVADMKADTKLKAGDMAITLGYYEPNDGGNGEYVIVDDDTLVDDGGSIHVLNNDLYAKLIIKDGIINIHQFGAKGNEVNDDYDAIINVLNYIKSNETKTETKSYLTLNFLPKTYYLGNVVEYDEYIDNLKINGNGAVIIGNGFKFGTKIGL